MELTVTIDIPRIRDEQTCDGLAIQHYPAEKWREHFPNEPDVRPGDVLHVLNFSEERAEGWYCQRQITYPSGIVEKENWFTRSLPHHGVKRESRVEIRLI